MSYTTEHGDPALCQQQSDLCHQAPEGLPEARVQVAEWAHEMDMDSAGIF